MKNKILTLALAAGLVTAGAGTAMAHHSYAMFDKTKTATLTGTVRNAHERRMAAAAAWVVDGVTDVENNITIG